MLKLRSILRLTCAFTGHLYLRELLSRIVASAFLRALATPRRQYSPLRSQAQEVPLESSSSFWSLSLLQFITPEVPPEPSAIRWSSSELQFVEERLEYQRPAQTSTCQFFALLITRHFALVANFVVSRH